MKTFDIRISNSKLKTYRRCQRQYEYKYVKGLRTRKRFEHLEKGSWLHKLLMVHYDGEPWREEHERLTVEFLELFEEEREELGDLPGECARIMKAYLRHWRKEDQHYKTIDTELDEIVELPNGMRLQIIVDKIVEDQNGLLWPVDYKSRKKLLDPGDGMIMDPQLSLYHGGLALLGYKPLGGVGYDELRTKAPAVPEPIKSGKRLAMRKNIDTTYETYLAAIKKHGFDPDDYKEILRILKRKGNTFFQRTWLPKDKPIVRAVLRDAIDTAEDILHSEERGRFPRTFIPRTCKWDCDFISLCMAEMHGIQTDKMVKRNFTVEERKD